MWPLGHGQLREAVISNAGLSAAYLQTELKCSNGSIFRTLESRIGAASLTLLPLPGNNNLYGTAQGFILLLDREHFYKTAMY